MSDLDVLRELAGQLRPPAYDEITSLAQKRRRRLATSALVGGAAAAVLTAGIVQAAISGDDRPVEPAPSPVPSPSMIDDASLERIRSEGQPLDLLDGGPDSAGEGGLEVQLYCVSEAQSPSSPCDPYHPYDPDEDQAWALEVRQGDRSGLFEVRGTPLVKDFDDDSVLVVDGSGETPRHRLLQADGTELELRLEEPAPPAPGPDVMLVQDIDVYRSGMIGPEGPQEPPYLVDDEVGSLRPLDVPADVEWWGPNVDEFLWGASGCRITWQQPDGTFARHVADCRGPGGYTNPGWNAEEASAAWLEPGRMVIVEWANSGAPKVVHASIDWGVTWERVEVEDRSWGDSIAVINDALAEALHEVEQR